MSMVIDGKWTNCGGALVPEGDLDESRSRLDGEIPADAFGTISCEPQRFHLVASLSCPWSHRVLITRRIKRLEPLVQVQIASGTRTEGYPVNGNSTWRLPGTEKLIVYVHEIYTTYGDTFTGRASVPLLWDSRDIQVLSNESLEIVKAFDRIKIPSNDEDFTLYSQDLQREIDELNNQIVTGLAKGVYRAGLARDQHDYNCAAADVFGTLDVLEERLSRGRLLFGRRLTLSDVVLFPVLIRFDIVYHTHFRCTRRRLIDYPMLWSYARDLYSCASFAEDVDFDAIQDGYFLNDGEHNPERIISDRPECDWSAPHQRSAFGTILVCLRGGGFREFAELAEGQID